MSMTPDEAAYDEYMGQLYEEHKKEAIEEFTGERLQSYWLANKLLAKPSVDMLSHARALISSSPTASHILGAIAMEVGLKATLLKPIVHGLVHTESVAALVTDLVVSHTGMDRYRKLLLQILLEHGGVDLENFIRSGSNKTLWEEMAAVQKVRNAVMHRAERASQADAELAIGVASEILESLFPAVVKHLDLHLHDGYRICSDWRCQYSGTPIGEALTGK